MPPPPLLILGASARAAAASARRAGFAPTTIDLFADRDLAARFPAHRVDLAAYPAALADLAAGLPDSPWIYTGALENHPVLIDRIGRGRRLLGIGGDSLRDVRDPSRWTAALVREGLLPLPCLGPGDAPPDSGRWLLKPLDSAMGRGIRAWAIGEGPIPDRGYLQAVARGVALGACFVGSGGTARLVGVTRQLLGPSVGGLRVVYRGSVGPWPVGDPARRAIGRIGEILAGAFGLAGLFGVDLVLYGETPRPVEINPRYTASVEVLEEALGVATLAEHARAFGVDVEPMPSSPGPGAVAKLILRARRPSVVPEGWPWSDPLAPWPLVADLPAAGTILAAGDPVLTVFGRGPDVESAMVRLRARAARWRRRIDGWPAP